MQFFEISEIFLLKKILQDTLLLLCSLLIYHKLIEVKQISFLDISQQFKVQ